MSIPELLSALFLALLITVGPCVVVAWCVTTWRRNHRKTIKTGQNLNNPSHYNP